MSMMGSIAKCESCGEDIPTAAGDCHTICGTCKALIESLKEKVSKLELSLSVVQGIADNRAETIFEVERELIESKSETKRAMDGWGGYGEKYAEVEKELEALRFALKQDKGQAQRCIELKKSLMIYSSNLEKLQARIQTCQECGCEYLADSHEYPCPVCHNDKASIYLEAINQISDICKIKENHGAKLTGINPIQRIIIDAHGKVLGDE